MAWTITQTILPFVGVLIFCWLVLRRLDALHALLNSRLSELLVSVATTATLVERDAQQQARGPGPHPDPPSR